MNKHQRHHLEQLVQDCEVFRLREKEALEYIKKRFGKEISTRHYYRIKRRLNSEEYNKAWLDQYSRIGFIIEHKKRLDEMIFLQKLCMEFFRQELSKPESQQDKHLILNFFQQTLKINRRISEISLGSPIVNNVKKLIEDNQRNNELPDSGELSNRQF